MLPLKIHIIIYIMTIFHTETEDEIHIISMRKAEPDEIDILAHYL